MGLKRIFSITTNSKTVTNYTPPLEVLHDEYICAFNSIFLFNDKYIEKTLA